MRKIYIIHFLIIFLLIACSQRVIKKPQKLIPEEKMEQILYDLSILNAVKNTNYSIFEKYYVDIDAIIYKKNGIDSLQLVENTIYYASFPEKYHQMITRVNKRIVKEDSLSKIAPKIDSLNKEELILEKSLEIK